MLADYGFFLLLLCLVASAYGTGAALFAAKLRHRRLYRSAQMAALATGLMSVIAAALLWGLLFARDYSVGYILRNSSNDLPPLYTFTAFWSALEGSHFLWTLLLAIYSAIAHFTYSRDNEHIMPFVSASLQAVLTWMFYLAVTYSDPFRLTLPIQDNGLGMNALLQNYYMAIHPPSLFTGYTALAIPYAYAMAALAYGDITAGWLRTIRRWTLFAWIFLTIGIFLGGRWAYVELGWAGYWAWDPVENSSFMPWLFATALLHALLVQDKIGHLKRLSIILAILAFFFSYFGTFITRSGIISSVHSFAQSPVGPNYLIFLAAITGIAVLLYAWRAPSILPADTNKVWGFSKESALVITQFLVLTFAIIIFIGTIYPIASEAVTGVRFNVQAPYFNAFAPYLGLAFIVAISIGNLMRYQSGKMVGGGRLLLGSLVLALPFTLLFAHFGKVFASRGFALGAQLVGVHLCFWALGCLLADLYVRLRDLRFKFSLFFGRNLAYAGAFVAHVGVLVAILGFLGNYRGVDKTVTLNAGESTDLYGYVFTLDGLEVVQDQNTTLYQANLKVTHDGVDLGMLSPARAKYPTKAELMHEIGLKGSFWHDLYAVLSDFDSSGFKRATVQIHVNPTVRIVWISAFLMVLGGLMALFDRVRGNKREALAGVMALLACCVLVPGQGKAETGSMVDVVSLSQAFQELSPQQQHLFRDVADELRCPTCTGLSVLQSDAAFSLQIREAVLDQVKQNKSEKDILRFFTERYGLWILREPPTQGFHLLAWAIPLAALVFGPLAIWLLVWRRRRHVDTHGLRPAEELLAQMNEELDRLRKGDTHARA